MIQITTTVPDEIFGNTVSVDPPTQKEFITFYANCHALRLVARGPNDNHIILELLTEDDGHWFLGQGNWGSSYWLPEIIKLAETAKGWMEKNCLPEVKAGITYGYGMP